MIDVTGVYCRGMTAEQLADEVLNIFYHGNEPKFPIDPFSMIRELGIIYQFMEFKGQEGIYLSPEDESDIPLIGINFGRPITRLRFTAAHELFHHLKDRNNTACPIGGRKSFMERYVDQFDSELLMPTKYLKRETEKYAVGGKVTREDALRLAEYFGTSFESTVFALVYKLNMLGRENDAKRVRKENSRYKPEQIKIEIGLDTENVNLWE